jgi:hypothetical protein
MKPIEIIQEWVKTFSNKPSFLSSKRIERFFTFIIMLAATTYYLFKGVYNWEISSTDLMLIVAGWLGFAGFNVIQGRKDNIENNERN